jgi:hypothetical protein
MNLPTIEMPADQARAAFEEYRGAVLRARQQDLTSARRTVRGLKAGIAKEDRALASGHALIDLPKALAAAGTVAVGRQGDRLPALAICRADAKVCHCEVDRSGALRFRADQAIGTHVRLTSGVNRDMVALPHGTLPETNRFSRARAIVPIIPPRLRPARGLGGLHVLWEAEWTLAAPIDPALLRHLGGDLWAVLAVWDLTPLEQAVVIGRTR